METELVSLEMKTEPMMTDYTPVGGDWPVVIIGAGAAGIAVARRVLATGREVVVLEAGSYVGGVWQVDNDNELSVAYDSLHINTEPKTTAYPGFPFPSGTPVFPDAHTVNSYLNDFTDAYDIRSRIRFHSKVIEVARQPDGLWSVETADGAIRLTDNLVVASGHLGVPAHPEDVRSTFTGRYLHVSQYRRPQDFASQRVLVIGLGNSGLDVASDLVTHAQSIDNVVRSPVLVMPRMVMGMPTATLLGKISRPWMPYLVNRQIQRTIARVFHGRMEQYGLRTPKTKTHPASSLTYMSSVAYERIRVRPGIRAVEGDRVEFDDGTSGTYDTIIAATGYKLTLPFLGGLAPVENRRLNAYKRILHPDVDGIFFAGFFNANGGPNISLMDLQAEYIVAILTGAAQRPSRVDMVRDLAEEHAHLAATFPGVERYGMELERSRYVKQMRKLIPASPLPPLPHHPSSDAH